MSLMRKNDAPSSSTEVLDCALRDTSTSTGMRRRLLEWAAVGAAGIAAARVIPASALAAPRSDPTHDVGVFTSTTEALTVTILTELLRRTSMHPEVPSNVSGIF